MTFSKSFNFNFSKMFLYYAVAEINRSNTYILSKYTKLFILITLIPLERSKSATFVKNINEISLSLQDLYNIRF